MQKGTTDTHCSSHRSIECLKRKQDIQKHIYGNRDLLKYKNNAVMHSRLLVLCNTFRYPHQVPDLLLSQPHVSEEYSIMELHQPNIKDKSISILELQKCDNRPTQKQNAGSREFKCKQDSKQCNQSFSYTYLTKVSTSSSGKTNLLLK